jgi:Bacterial membrane protein YfhO
MRRLAETDRRRAYERLRRLVWDGVWRRRLVTLALIVGANAAVLTVTYRAVVFHDRTLLTGTYLQGTEFVSGPYGYPGPVPVGWNEVDAGASAWGFVPQIKKAHLELTQGELPLWDANVMLGAPLAADATHGLFNPLTWPLVASPTPGVWDAWLLARLLAAGVFCTYLCRYLGLRAIPATVAGFVYMMSGVFELRTTTIQTGVMAMLPLLILGFERCLRQPSRTSSGILALAVASSVLFGMPEETALCVLMGAAWFLVRFAAQWIRTHKLPPVNVAYAAVGGGVVGLLFSLPLILPFSEYVGNALTQHPPGSHPSLQLEDWRQLLSFVGPHWNIVGPRGFSGALAPVDNWFGIGALVLAGLGAFSRALPRSVRILLAVTAVAVVAKVFGFPDWYNQLFANTPLLGQITFWAYSGVLVSLAVALLAGAGLQSIALGRVKPRHVLACATVLVAITAALAPTYLSGTPVRFSQVAITVGVLLVVVAGALLASDRLRWARRAGVLLIAGAVTAELILLATPELPLPLSYDPLSATPTTAYLQRTMPSGSGRSYSPTGILYPTTNQAFNLDDLRNLDALYIERTYRYLKLFVVPGLTDRFDGSAPNAAQFVDNPFFDALNVETILVGPPLSVNAASLPANQFALETVAADGVGIYRNLHASPRAQVFFNVRSATSEQGAATAMSRSGFDPRTSAVVETSQSPPASTQPPVPARIDRYADNQVEMTTTTSSPGILVLADAYYPGWQADLDGKPTPIYPVDIALRGVKVPAGTHTVTMEYRPRPVLLGALGVPAGVLVFGLGGWGLPALQRARRRLKAVAA